MPPPGQRLSQGDPVKSKFLSDRQTQPSDGLPIPFKMKIPVYQTPWTCSAGRSLALGVALVLLTGAGSAFGQAAVAPQQNRRNLANPADRAAMVAELTARARQEKDGAENLARANGWQIRGRDANGATFELMRIDERGMPSYNGTGNANAAISTGASQIRNQAPYYLNGQGFTVGVWDAGAVRATHQEFATFGNTTRVVVKDPVRADNHATHVAGTIGASGVFAPNARGMANQVRLESYDWNNHFSEMAEAAAATNAQTEKLLISNHSYGYRSGWEPGEEAGSPIRYLGKYPELEDYKFGNYGNDAREWDKVCYSAPYLLPFKAAGNDRNNTGPAAGSDFQYYDPGTRRLETKPYDPAEDPYFADGWDNGGFDTMETQACAKNVMTIGAANDAVSGGTRWVANGTMSAFSGWGPTDDGRIKPDLVANGVGVYSTFAFVPVSPDSTFGDVPSDTAYNSIPGTSMAISQRCRIRDPAAGTLRTAVCRHAHARQHAQGLAHSDGRRSWESRSRLHLRMGISERQGLRPTPFSTRRPTRSSKANWMPAIPRTVTRLICGAWG
jgi:hypothetical protein